LNQLTLTGGTFGITAILGSSFQAFNLQITAQATGGVDVNSDSVGSLSGSTVLETGGFSGVSANWGGTLLMNGGTVQNSFSGGDGVTARNGGHVTLRNGVIVQNVGFHAVEASSGGSIEVRDATIKNSRLGVMAWEGGSVFLGPGALVTANGLEGGVTANAGHVVLEGAVVSGNSARGVLAYLGGTVTIQSGAVIRNNAGDGLVIVGGSSATIQNTGTIIQGNSGNGVTIHDTSVLVTGDLGAQIINNQGWGILCSPAPAVAGIAGNPSQIATSGNGAGQVSCPTLP